MKNPPRLKSFVSYTLDKLKQLTALAILLFVISWVYNAVGDSRYAQRIYIPVPEEQTYRIVAFGDSLVEGLGSTHMAGFVDTLSENLNEPIYNAGVRRNKSADLVTRITEDVLVWNPDVVVIVVGGNDIIRRVPESETRANLEILFSMLRERDIEVVFGDVTMSAPFLISRGEDFQNLAMEYGVVYVPDLLGSIFWDPTKKFDLLHPNDEGYLLIAEKLQPYVQEALERKNAQRILLESSTIFMEIEEVDAPDLIQ